MIGQALIRQKDRLPHGMFLPWIAAEFQMSQSASDRFMQVAKVYSGKLPTVGNLGTTAIYDLAAPSTPPEVQAEVERRIQAGELVNAADIKRLKDDFDSVKQIASEKFARLRGLKR